MNQTTSLSVLHGSCHLSNDGITFFFWSEISESKGKKDARTHPFSNSAKATFELLLKAGLDQKVMYNNVTLKAIFPTSSNLPLPSGELSGLITDGNEDDNAAFSFQEWHVQGVSMNVNDAFQFLIGLAESPGDNEIIMGSDLKFWKSAFAMAFNLVIQRKFMPAVTEEGTAIRSKWIPLMETQEDQNLLYDLSKNMPGACLAFNHGEVDPESMVRAFLSIVIDSTCRKFTGNMGVRTGLTEGGDALKWVKSLSSQDSLVTYSKSLAMQKIMSWTRRIQNTLEFPLRTCFDLVPPEENSENWYLEFLLQSKKDPSLMIPYSEVWNRNNRDALSTIKKFTEFPEEFLLQSIGVAQSIFQSIRKSLQIARPGGVSLTSDEVFDLLKNYSATLRDSGFGILFPDWLGKSRNKLGLKIKAKPSDATGPGKLGMMALLDYELEIALDGDPLSPEDLEKLAKLKSPFVQFGKKWVEVDREHLGKILKLLSEKRTGVPLMELLTLSTENDSIPVVEISGEGWVGDLFNDAHKMRTIKQPKDFTGSLREYQKQGVSWLSFMTGLGFGCCLADDMGLGKTIEIIAFLLHRIKAAGNDGVTLILCPTSVISNWEHEFKRFAPKLKVLVHHGTSRSRNDEFLNVVVNYDIVLTSYALVHRDIDFLSGINWDGVIADEAQYVKNYSTRQSRAIRSLQSNFRIALT